jgi:quercetin dioxygenase-like cupin family protein
LRSRLEGEARIGCRECLREHPLSSFAMGRNAMKFAAVLVAGLCITLAQGIADAQDMAVHRKLSANKFVSIPVFPSCITQAVESGDPSKGASVIIFKATTGCVVPWHWHTPTENLMVVSGSVKLEMKDGGHTAMIGPGGYAMLPGKHVHQFTCLSTCVAFVTSDSAFDIHYVDANGKEIPIDSAIAKKKGKK